MNYKIYFILIWFRLIIERDKIASKILVYDTWLAFDILDLISLNKIYYL